VSTTGDPIVFVTRSRIRDGQLDALRAFLRDGVPAIERAKPRTLAFLPYLDEASREITIIHVFADAPSMTAHFEGLGERMAAAAPFIETIAYEVYGRPADELLGMLRSLAGDDVRLDVRPEGLTGYLRLPPG
jgi:quinol monooxygenase YgiN